MINDIVTMAGAVYDLLANGDYTGGWYTVLGIEEDSWVIDVTLTVRGWFVR